MNARTLTRAAAQRPTAAGTLVNQCCPACGAVVRKAGSVIYDWQIDECPHCYSLVMFTMGKGGDIKRKLLPYRNKVAGHLRSSGEQTDQDPSPQSGMRSDNDNAS